MTSKSENFLIVGADSFLGAKLIKVLEDRGCSVSGTTRRKENLRGNRIFLDLYADNFDFIAPEGTTYAYLLAGIVDYSECERNPKSWEVNVEKMTLIAQQLMRQGVFVTFISSNTVFGGERPWCHEDAKHMPKFTYARHKSAAESAIREMAKKLGSVELFNVVRLTKILSIKTPPLPSWSSAIQQGETFYPFSDLIIAPMSLRFTAESLAEIGHYRLPGNLHLSGEENISYVKLAHALGAKMSCDPQLINPTTSAKMNVDIPFKPQFSGISMQRTSGRTGIQPQSLQQVVNDLALEYRSS